MTSLAEERCLPSVLMIDCTGQSEVKYYYHFDGLGSVVALTDTNADVVERYSYNVFGEPNATSSIGNPYMFTGRECDSETGLYYYRARYYNPEIGRFLSPDPINTFLHLNFVEFPISKINIAEGCSLNNIFQANYPIIDDSRLYQSGWSCRMA